MIGNNGNGANTSFNIPMVPAGNGGYGYGGGYGYPMPVMPFYAGNYGNNGFGNGGDWGWILLLLLAFNGGWNGFGGGFGGFGMDGFPWILASNQNGQNQTNDGFQHAATQNQLSNIQNAVTTGFSNAEVANCNRAIDALQTAYSNEIASLNRSFAEQAANAQGFNNVQSQLSRCCCDQELATANLSALVQRENCADREALSNGIRDIITAQTAGTQRIIDQLCNDKIDAKNEKIAELQNQVNMQNLAASQISQTAALIQDNNAQTAALIQRIAPYPVPAYPVNNPYGCGNNWWGNGFGNGFGNGNFGNGFFGNNFGPLGTF